MSLPEYPAAPSASQHPAPIPQPVEAPGSGVPVTWRTWALAMAGVIVGGIASVVILEMLMVSYEPSVRPDLGNRPAPEDVAKIGKAYIQRGSLSYAATGTLVGLMLGLAGGIARRSVKAAALAGLVGLLVGGIVEGGVARLSLWLIYMKFEPGPEEMLHSLLSHEALWDAVGLTGGLAFGLGLGGKHRWWKTAFGGLIGAAMATVVFEFLGALVFSTHGTHQPLADSLETRALAQIMIPLGTAIGAVLAARPPRSRPNPPTVPKPLEA